jgi:predicted transcriptional regulator
MQRSKLIAITGILTALNQNGPLNTNQIAEETNLKIAEINSNLQFLTRHRLIKNHNNTKDIPHYVITPRGTKIPIFFGTNTKTLLSERNRKQTQK